MSQESVIRVRVRTGCKNAEIFEHDGIVHVKLKSRPEKGKANLELTKLLSKQYRAPVKIISGLTCRDKTVRIG